MTVKELIEKLQQIENEDAPVKVMVASQVQNEEEEYTDYLFSDTDIMVTENEEVVTIYGDLGEVFKS